MWFLLKQRSRPDGVFCYNDPLAIGAMTAILEAGLVFQRISPSSGDRGMHRLGHVEEEHHGRGN
jgi:DNA-binding LacI/PurR family transcriptional regulator